jgi:deoxyribonuclease V
VLAILDVHYADHSARAACVLAAGWESAIPARSWTAELSSVAPYEPGRFFLRELPCLLEVLRGHPVPDQVLIDGYVWLDESRTPGLGAHLHDALGRTVPVVGIAKTAFKGSRMAVVVHRGASRRPLFVTSAGMDASEAAALVHRMAGAGRLPTLVRLADRLSRSDPPKNALALSAEPSTQGHFLKNREK